jgi:O-antigen/teichoic acid export membrane protein
MKIQQNSNLNGIALKSGSIYMLSNIMISSLSIITAPIFTRLLSTQDYGIASNFASWVNIGLVIVGLGLSYTIGNAKNDYPNDLKYFLASIQLLNTLFGLLVLVFVLILKNSLSNIMGVESNLVIIIFVYLLFLPSVIYSQEKFKFQLRSKENVFITLFGSIGSILFCLIFINFIFNDKRYFGRIIGLILPFFLMGLFFYIKIFINGWNSNITKYWKYALKISVPMIPHALSMLVLTQMDRIMIVKMCGNSDAGLFSFGYTYAVLLLLISNAVLQAFQPWLYIKYKINDLHQIKIETRQRW